MADKIKFFKIYTDEEPKAPQEIKEEITPDSNLELNPAIKDKNFFEDKEIVDYLLDKAK